MRNRHKLIQMLREIVYLLGVDKHIGQGECIDIAKGRDKIPMSISEGYRQIQRKRWHKK